jgi:hypothetical protein
MHATSAWIRPAGCALPWSLMILMVSACGSPEDRVADRIQTTPVEPRASAAGEKPRFTGRPQPAIAAGPVAYIASGPTPLAVGCEGAVSNGTAYIGAEVEPHLAAHPSDPNLLVGVWQQDRWSNGSARALVAATSLDRGRNWTRALLPFSRCGGGTVFNGGDYQRASDPWVSYSPNGVVHAMSLSTNGGVFQAGSANAMLASRSFDHGRTWSNPATLIRDGQTAFNDKNALTADPHEANFVYAVWDRLIQASDRGPAYFARSTDGGASWEAARAIFDPGVGSQTIGNIIAVLPNGTLIDVFNQIDTTLGGVQTSRVAVLRSFDRGASWSAPIYVADLLAVGTRDPQTGIAVRDGSIVPSIAVAPDGVLYVAWQDSRFSGGIRDAIAISRSIDGGASWSAPVRVNGAPNVAAFTPNVHVNADGTVGVTYYDLRSDTAAAPLSTDSWLARSNDGGTSWRELRLGDAFDMTLAPFANGFFVGDYTGLVSITGRFLPFQARTNAGAADNITDVVAISLENVIDLSAKRPSVAQSSLEAKLRRMPVDYAPDIALRLRVDRNLRGRLRRPPQAGAAERMLPHYAMLALLR